jgi:hypothetical protein
LQNPRLASVSPSSWRRQSVEGERPREPFDGSAKAPVNYVYLIHPPSPPSVTSVVKESSLVESNGPAVVNNNQPRAVE